MAGSGLPPRPSGSTGAIKPGDVNTPNTLNTPKKPMGLPTKLAGAAGIAGLAGLATMFLPGAAVDAVGNALFGWLPEESRDGAVSASSSSCCFSLIVCSCLLVVLKTQS